ncbi:MAG: hypothetical protein KatS3mg105_2167 [Gemmatales bacterium]|nr:MAG: hypothetical protein KatS3mg105_2167 [Gemmatales bacterium]
MFELFANPANMVLGGLLISSPIIIHLINRMRFKRIRWAAMEFLLKSQKRNRRRLIIEQLLLLLLRILLVLLAGLLLARFIGYALGEGFTPHQSVHLIILDDRLSMSDHWKENDEVVNCFAVGKREIVNKIARNLAQNTGVQRLVLRRLSRPDHNLFDERVSERTYSDLQEVLNATEPCTELHLDLNRGLEEAEKLFDQHATAKRSLYIVSDFRQRHWFEPENTGVINKLKHLAENDVKIHLLDTAHPERSDDQTVPRYHNNLAIVDLRPQMRVAPQNYLVPFRVSVTNYGIVERKAVRVAIKVNGAELPQVSQMFATIEPNRTVHGTFQIPFQLNGKNAEFQVVEAVIENEEEGIDADNRRFAVVEVREQVPVLVVDGGPNPDDPNSDSSFLATALGAERGFEVVPDPERKGGVRGPALLESPDLSKYACICIANVDRFTDVQLKNLKEYVQRGGGVVFFLGDRVDPDYYNKHLYADGTGIFPVPLASSPTRELTEKERVDRVLRNLIEQRIQVYLRDREHPVLQNLPPNAFKFIYIHRYFPVPRLKWKFNPKTMQELMTLPNTSPVANYEGAVLKLLEELPIGDADYLKFSPSLEFHRRNIRAALAKNSMSDLADALRFLLEDPGLPDDPNRLNLQKDFWSRTDPKIIALHRKLKNLQEAVQYGDPLMVAGRYGSGRTVAVLTTAGRKWNNWAGGSPASFTFPVMMVDLQKFLSSVPSDDQDHVGTTKTFVVDAARYEPQVSYYRKAESEQGNEATTRVDEGRLVGTEENDRLQFEFDRSTKPGVYVFEFKRRPSATDQGGIEAQAFAFNVNTNDESDLRRARSKELSDIEKSIVVDTFADKSALTDIANKPADLSESAWIYLAFLVVLIIEQALAVHLSFHLRGAAAPPPQAVRPQPTAV